ncbi:actin-like ATPase domain-containing protein [Jaminaea rosea]|uniref:Actin-like ATPase domain-containing protein n=1 Tax=Jaminaea rosea TaxID=1569628 RepID=A0A316UPP4_9BASI|nr:actin-like ATPase domain-containing protein [Jaminaea rosea]PWN25105.1 actin-like ATPase domain-containing protein [Jaminaea rosea]
MASTAAPSSSSSRQYLAPPSSAIRPSASSSGGGGGVTRRHSLFGTEDRIVLDLGSRYSKVGFSGEAQPRAVFRTLNWGGKRPAVDALYAPQAAALGDDEGLAADVLMWDLDIGRGEAAHAEAKGALLAARLTVMLRRIFHDALNVDPSQRKVILVENPQTPRIIRQCCLQALFDNLKVPSVSAMPAPIMTLMAHGATMGLVVSVGVLETSVVPVVWGRVMGNEVRRNARAARGLERRTRALLLRYGRVVVCGEELEKGQRRRTRKVERTDLTQQVLEEVLMSKAFVAAKSAEPPSSRSNTATSASLKPRRPATTAADSGNKPPPDWRLPPTGDDESVRQARTFLSQYDEADDQALLSQLRTRYKTASTASHITFPLPPMGHDDPAHTSIFPTAPATFALPPDQQQRANARKSSREDLIIPGWLRERVADYFWDSEDAEDDSDEDECPPLHLLILSTLLRLPIDLRRPLARSILVTGGVASMPGFAHRMGNELRAVLDEVTEEDLAGAMVNLAVTPVAQRGKGAGATGGGKSARYATLKPLRDELNVANDHSPPEGLDSGAPLLPPMLHAWFGASLAGSLRLSSVETVRLDQWQAATKAAEEQVEKEKEVKTGGFAVQPGMPPKRGSFMGIVGGLDTGAFGGLAAVSRQLSR